MERLFAFFNKLGRRERWGFVLAAAVTIYFIMDIAMLSPQRKRFKAVNEQVAKLEGDLAAIRNDMVITKAQLDRDPFAKDRAQLDAFKRAIDEASAFLAKVESDPRQVGIVLRQLIGATPGVTLVSLRTLPVVAVSESKSVNIKQAPAKSIYRRGIEVTVKGNYLALLPYLEKLQNMKTRVLWSEAELDAQQYPESQLRLTIFTLSTQPEASIG
jgi:MSHA biogenesis protein MshJ